MLPKSLAALASHRAVESIEDERDWDNGYWLHLKPGWYSPDMDCRSIHEFTVAEIKRKLSRAIYDPSLV